MINEKTRLFLWRFVPGLFAAALPLIMGIIAAVDHNWSMAILSLFGVMLILIFGYYTQKYLS